MLDEKILDAFVWNFRDHPDKPCYAIKLMENIRKVMNDELPEMFPLTELNEVQWELLENRILNLVKHEIMLMKVEYLPREKED